MLSSCLTTIRYVYVCTNRSLLRWLSIQLQVASFCCYLSADKWTFHRGKPSEIILPCCLDHVMHSQKLVHISRKYLWPKPDAVIHIHSIFDITIFDIIYLYLSLYIKPSDLIAIYLNVYIRRLKEKEGITGSE